jgi:lipopolysaccharide export system permease protein
LLRSSFLNDAEEYLYAMLKKDRCIKRYDLPYCIWVREVQGKRLQDAIFKRRDTNKGTYDVIARAREAELHVDLANKQVLVHMRHCYLFNDNGKGCGYFQDKIWPVPLPPDFGTVRNVKPRAMSVPDLFLRRLEVLEEMEKRATEIALAMGRLAMTQTPHDLPMHLDNLNSVQKQRQQEIYNIEGELHMRPALAFGCLFFVLVGCPVGIWFSRSDYLSAFITCFLPIVFLYYPVLLCCTNYAKQGKAPPMLALWAANLFMGTIALGLFRRLLKH